MMANITCIIRVIIVVAIIQIMQLWLPELIMLLARLKDWVKKTEAAAVLFFKKTVPGLPPDIILFLKTITETHGLLIMPFGKKKQKWKKQNTKINTSEGLCVLSR